VRRKGATANKKAARRMIRRSGYRFADQIMRQLKKLARDHKIARWGGLSS